MRRFPSDRNDSAMEEMVEARVRERTAELTNACEDLEREIAEQHDAERVTQAHIETLTTTFRMLAAAPGQDAFIEQALMALMKYLEVPSGSFWAYDALKNACELQVTVGNGPDSARESLPEDALINWDAPLPRNRFLLYQNSAPDAGWVEPEEPLVFNDTPTWIRVPVVFEKEYLGSFILYSTRTHQYTNVKKELAGVIAQQVAPILRLSRRASQDQDDAVLEERYRLACEIHDALAQHFAGILLQIGVAQRIAKQQPDEAWDLVAQAGILARTAAEEARRSVWALQPTAMEYSDLAKTLTRTVAQMTEGTTVRGEVYLYGEPRLLPPDVGMNLLRVGQEALTNALRHAHAQHIFAELTFDAASVRLCILDDGRGFELENQGTGGGFGMIGMRQRAERIGGHLTVSSQPGQGTEVAVMVATGAPQEIR